ncbi:hypothetical protein DFH08DRAFT_912504 [Mycena albidolilacea]|uniref:Uncharacterized protein n=1 Tax=Mycena albidolilacea TaxID=1033008 RepID=A0AAD7AE32_9AGAR|nr:hypothetical protein DFH08DRAFT_912504 [Mycena albidolilacea]
MTFKHTRAQLVAIARQYKPLPTDGYDPDPDDVRVPQKLVEQVVRLLGDEQEDELKELLKSTYDLDDETIEQSVLDLMHKHHDDEAGVPFLFLTPTRRPISRPSSRASARLRPETPSSAPSSPLAAVFRRPHTPLTSPLGPVTATSYATSYMTAKSEYSPQSSPVLTHAPQFTASLPASPLSSPRLLNAKATEFKPIPRPLSAASSNPAGLRAETPSPDMWSHSPLRSNLAIAAPLIPERSLTPSSSLRSSMLLGDADDEDDDPFDPFGQKSLPHSFHSLAVSDYDAQWSTNSNESRSPESLDSLHANFSDASGFSPPEDTAEMEAAAAAMLTEGMTPFDVLSSVFGSTLAPSELEEALAANGYDFERAMAWLVDRAVPAVPQQPTPQLRIQQMGGRVTVVARDPSGAHGRGGQDPRPPPRYVNGRPAQGGNRVCRYFVAGECLRADCRFSHDLERALCRFWLRGTCAKQDNCEFLHHLPKDVDMSSLSAAMSRANVPPGTGPLAMHTAAMQGPPPDDFPALGVDGNKARRGAYSYMNDPGRTRFAAAVKKPVAREREMDPTLVARREAMGYGADNLYHRNAIVAPRASPRLKLRPPALLPTLSTGDAVQSLYMAYRARALQLGAARNACLSRAADAWRRGREGHELNEKMGKEMAGAAAKLVRERARVAEQAVRGREAGWSDDPGDRAARGKSVGGGLGVCLGVAARDTGDGKLTAEERTECVLDLHGLHANEATEVLEEFLLALEHEHFYGLAYVIVGEEKHTGTQDAARGASRARLATGVREWVHRWGYPWSERDGIICVDALTHASE